MRPAEIRLAPERARVGSEIRVVGNDAGEKLSILAGTLARLDRDAPIYGASGYNDFNTFYYQAASSTSGGSSGSPVVDVSGQAVALNAGGSRNASSSFFLPLDRVVRALALLRAGKPVPARHPPGRVSPRRLRRAPPPRPARARPRRAVRRRFPEETGLLVVDEVVPAGPAYGALEPGDVLLSVGGRPVREFATLEALLDDAVGRERRARGRAARRPPSDPSCPSRTSTPSLPRRISSSGAACCTRSPSSRRATTACPVAGLYVASPGYALARAGVPAGAVVTAVGGSAVSDLGALEARLAEAPDGARLPVRWFALERPRTSQLSVLPVDRRWYPMARCTRDDADGRLAVSPVARAARRAGGSRRRRPPSTRRARARCAPSRRRSCSSSSRCPTRSTAPTAAASRGSGLVVDAERGLVVVDRDTVPVSLGDVRLTFARSLSVPGRVVALHPEHGLAVVAYDPALLGDTPVRSARLETEPLAPGDELFLVGFDPAQRLVSRRTEVARIEEQAVPLPEPPRFREANLELVFTTESVATVGGVLADCRGRVRALWSSISKDVRGGADAFFAGVPSDLVEEMVAPLRAGQPLRWRSLGLELGTVALADAARARPRAGGGGAPRGARSASGAAPSR